MTLFARAPLTALASLAALLLAPCGAEAGAGAPASPEGVAQPPPTAAGPSAAPHQDAGLTIPYHLRTLANGLQVYTVRDDGSPNVAVQVWYGVGSRDDPEGRSGFAHLFEHMMFKATRDMPAEFMDRLTEDAGGANNASTSDDYTNFFEIAPANQLQRLLWAEAERMSSLTVDAAAFASERAVVKEELRQSYLANPYGRLFLAVRDAAYTLHPYRRSTIGSMGDLDAATLGDVKKFHDVFYRPDNAALIIVGNFDPATLDGAIDAWFGGVGRPDVAIPRVLAVEPPMDAPVDRTVYAPGVPLPALDLAWHIPAAASADLAPLRVADAILTAGDASRLNHDLVYAAQIAQSVGSDAGQNRDPSLFQVQVVAAGGHGLDEVRKAALEEIERLRTTPVSDEELRRAKNQLLASALLERETIEGRGFQLGRALRLEGDAARADLDVAALEGVSAQDVRRVAGAYLGLRGMTTVRYLDDAARPRGEAPGKDLAMFSPMVEAMKLPAAVKAAPPPAALPTSPPSAGPLVAGQTPRLSARTLANGLQVLVARTAAAPMVTAELTVRGGAALDPQGRFGLASLTTDLLPRGAGGLSASEIARQVEAAGGSLKSETGYDGASLVLTVLAKEFAGTLKILADVARHPAFEPEEIERLRRQKIDDLTVSLTQPGSLAEALVSPLVFGDGPHGQVLEGSPASLKAIGRADVLSAYEAAFRPDAAVLVITGDVEPEAAFALAKAAFGDWRPGRGPVPAVRPPAPEGAPRVIAVDLPNAGQAAVVLAGRTIGRQDPRYYALRTADAVLGGGFSSRLNAEVRIKRGLSYGASSHLEGRSTVSLVTMTAQTKNASAGEVAELMVKTAAALATAPLTDEELRARKTSLVGGYGRTVATSSGLAAVAGSNAVEGLGPDEVAAYPVRIAAVSAADARQAARLLLPPAGPTVIVVGDGRDMLPDLRRRFPKVTVVAAKDLDLSVSGLGLAPPPAP